MSIITLNCVLLAMLLLIVKASQTPVNNGNLIISEYERKAIAKHLADNWTTYQTKSAIIKGKSGARLHDVYWQPQTSTEKAKLVFFANEELDGQKAVLGQGANGIAVKGFEVSADYYGFNYMNGEKVVIKKSLTVDKYGRYDADKALAARAEIDRESWFLDMLETNKAAANLEDPHTKAGVNIQKFFDGGELAKHLQTMKNVDGFVDAWNEVEKVITDLHSKEIVHFDMHSSNIMLQSKGGFVPIDFGRAVFTGSIPSGELKDYLRICDRIIAMGDVRSAVERSLGTEHDFTKYTATYMERLYTEQNRLRPQALSSLKYMTRAMPTNTELPVAKKLFDIVEKYKERYAKNTELAAKYTNEARAAQKPVYAQYQPNQHDGAIPVEPVYNDLEPVSMTSKKTIKSYLRKTNEKIKTKLSKLKTGFKSTFSSGPTPKTTTTTTGHADLTRPKLVNF